MPRPITLTAARRDRVERFLRDEFAVIRDDSGRRVRIERWAGFLRRYEAKRQKKNFPFRDASNLHVPYAASGADSVKIKLLGSLKGQDRVVTAEPFSEDRIADLIWPDGRPVTWRDAAELIESYASIEVSPAGEVDLLGAFDSQSTDTVHLGTSILKPVWETIVERDWSEDGSRTVDRTVRDNIRFVVIPPEDCYFPNHYPDFSRIPWISHSYLARPSEILQKSSGLNPVWNRKEVLEFLEAKADLEMQARISPLEQTQDEIEGVDGVAYYRNDELPLAETWAYLDLDGSGVESKVLIDHTFDEPFRIFRITGWPYSHGKRPFLLTRFILRRNKILGMGAIERVESIDDGISSNVNQIIDAGTIGNCPVWTARAGGITAQEAQDIWPGKVIPVEEKGDLDAIKLPGPDAAIFEVGNVLRGYGDRLLKLTDDAPAMDLRKTPATTALAVLRESGAHHDHLSRETRITWNEALQQWLDLIIQQRPFKRIELLLGPEKGGMLVKILSLPGLNIRQKVGMRIALSTTAASRELARQEEAAKVQIVKDYYTSMMALLGARRQYQALGDTPAVLYIDAVAKDSELKMKRLLETFGEPYSSITLASWERTIANASLSSPLLPQPGGPNPNPGNGGGLPVLGSPVGGNVPPSGGSPPPLGGGGNLP